MWQRSGNGAVVWVQGSLSVIAPYSVGSGTYEVHQCESEIAGGDTHRGIYLSPVSFGESTVAEGSLVRDTLGGVFFLSRKAQ